MNLVFKGYNSIAKDLLQLRFTEQSVVSKSDSDIQTLLNKSYNVVLQILFCAK